MIPKAEKSLGLLSNRLIAMGLEQSTDLYNQSNYVMTATLVEFLTHELANGVDHRYRDIVDMQSIFSSAEQRYPTWWNKISGLASKRPDDFRLESMDRLHDECTAQLIALHEQVEEDLQTGDAAAREINQAIWEYLGVMTERHRLTP